MNKHYKVIWSKVKHSYVVVSELAKSNGKAASTHIQSGQRIGVALSVLALCASISGVAQAETMGPNAILAEVTGFGSSINSETREQGATATIYGPVNLVDATSATYDGVANSIVGVANATKNSNASLIFGAGNSVKNSYGNVDINLMEAQQYLNQPDKLSEYLASKVGESGGQILVIGGANTIDNARFSSVTGVSNKLVGSTDTTKADGSSDYNFVSGAKNTVTESDNTYLIGTNNVVSGATGNALVGDYRSITGGANNVILGSGEAGNVLDTTVSNVVVAGYNANASVADGVAIGSNSVASVAAGVAGAAPTKTTVSDDDKKTATWTSTLGAVSVGSAGADGKAVATRQITNVAAGTQDTDAVNLAQLNKVASLINTSNTGSGVEYVSINSTAAENKDNSGAANSPDAIAIGAKASVVPGPVTAGETNGASSQHGVAIGYNSNVTGSMSGLALGGETTVSNSDEGVAIGRKSSVVDSDMSASLGYLATNTNSEYSVALGSFSEVKDSNNAVALGYGASASKANHGVAVGSEASVTASNGVALGANSVASTAARELGYNPLTGAQFTSFEEVSSFVGMSSEYENLKTQRETLAATVATQEAEFNRLQALYEQDKTNAEVKKARDAASAALEVSETQLNNVDATINHILSAYASSDSAVSVGRDASQRKGKITSEITRQITHVAAGTKDTDAVNVAQLKALNTKVDDGATHYFSVNGPTPNGSNYENDGATAANSMAIGVNASTASEDSLVIGSSTINNIGKSSKVVGNSNALDRSVETRVFGDNNKITNSNRQLVFGDNNTLSGRDQGTVSTAKRTTISDVVIGKGNAITGNDTYWKGTESLTIIGNNNTGINPTSAIVIGDNQDLSSQAGSVIIGSLDEPIKERNWTDGGGNVVVGFRAISKSSSNVVLGNSAVAGGTFQTIAGVGSKVDHGAEDRSGVLTSVYGAFNNIEYGYEDVKASTDMDSTASSIVGALNHTKKANGAIIVGSGNEILNSNGEASPYAQMFDVTMWGAEYLSPERGRGDFDTLVQKGFDALKNSGASITLGSANKSDYATRSQILGNGNILEGSNEAISSYNTISGYSNSGNNISRTAIIGSGNTISDTTDNIVLGDYHEKSGGEHNVILGSQKFTETIQNVELVSDYGLITKYDLAVRTPEKPHTKDISNAVMLGYNIDVTINGGVALGSESIAATDSSVQGYNPTAVASTATTPTTRAAADATTDAAALDSATWKSTLGAVSVGYAAEGDTPAGTRQITNVAAGTDATDAVNVAQLKAAKVTVTGGTNVASVESTATLDGGTVYTINTIDKDTKITDATYNDGTLTINQSEGSPITVSGFAKASDIAAAKTHYYSVNGPENPANNYYNDGAIGNNALAAGVGAKAEAHNSVAVGNNATILDSNGGKGSGDIAIGNAAKINNYADQSAGISIGQNAFVENMAGKQEAIFALGQTTFSGDFLSTARIPAEPAKVAAGIAIGENAYARSGSLMVGTHKYVGEIGDVTVNTTTEPGRRATGVGVNATTIGTNSFNHGSFSTITGAYSIATGDYAGGRNSTSAGKNFGATIVGSLNSIESATASNNYSGVANSVVGFANKTANANGALIFGAGNEITNSVTSISIPGTGLFESASAADSAKELQDKLKTAVKNSNSGGSTLAIGGANKADYTRASSIIGVNNTLTGTATNRAEGIEEYISQYNSIMGYNNQAANVSDVTVAGINNTITGTETAVVLGDNHTVTGANNSIVIGSADAQTELTATDATVIGHNANVNVAGGVALGSGAIATVDKGQIGYDISGTVTDLESALGNNKAAYDSLQNDIKTAQEKITTLNTEIGALQEERKKYTFWDDEYGELGQQIIAKQKELAETEAIIPGKEMEVGKLTSTWIATGAAVSVGDADKGITRQITNVAAGTQDTDAVNVAQLKAAAEAVTNTAAGGHTEITLNGKTLTKDNPTATDNNLTLAVKTDTNGKNIYDIKMNKDLVVGTEAKPGTPGENGQPGTPGEAGSITIIGTPGPKGEDGQPGKDTSANISVKDGAKGLDGKDGVTRIVYTDEDNKEHQVATMDDGLKFAGDDGDKNVVPKKLNEQLDIKGGADSNKLTDSNIGVVADVDSEGKAIGLHVKLAQNINLGNAGSIKFGDGDFVISKTAINFGGATIKNSWGGQIAKGSNDIVNGDTIYKFVKDQFKTGGIDIVADDGVIVTRDGSTYKIGLKLKGVDTPTDTTTVEPDKSATTPGTGTEEPTTPGTETPTNPGVETPTNPGTDTGNTGTDSGNTGTDAGDTDTGANTSVSEGKDINISVETKPITVGGDSGTAEATAGSQFNVVGDTNITTVASVVEKDGVKTPQVQVQLNKDLTGLNSVTTGNTTINNNGLTVKGNDGKDGATITSDGLTIKGEDGKDKVVVSCDKVDMGGNRVQGVGDAEDATDAVNKGQLDNALNAVGNGMNQMSNRISKLDRRVDRVGAGAAALAALHPLEFSPEAKWEVSAGVGNYKGANAVALGAFYRPNGDTMFSIGTSLGGGENMVNAGVTLRVGDGETENYPARKVMAQQIKDLQSVVDTQNAKIEQLTQLVNTLVGANQQIQPVVSAPQAQTDVEKAQ